MRREYKKQEQSYIDWLKSLGCVLYLPLTEGDFQDKISGNQLQLLSGKTPAVWDSQVGMYYFTNPSYHSKSYTLNNGWNAQTFNTNEVTILTTFKKKSANGNGSTCCVGKYWLPIGSANMQNGGTSVVTNWSSNVSCCAYYMWNNGRKLYENGNLAGNYEAYAPYLPSNWGSYDWYFGSYSSFAEGVQVYISEIYVFNREVSLSDIRKIQGYE